VIVLKENDKITFKKVFFTYRGYVIKLVHKTHILLITLETSKISWYINIKEIKLNNVKFFAFWNTTRIVPS